MHTVALNGIVLFSLLSICTYGADTEKITVGLVLFDYTDNEWFKDMKEDNHGKYIVTESITPNDDAEKDADYYIQFKADFKLSASYDSAWSQLSSVTNKTDTTELINMVNASFEDRRTTAKLQALNTFIHGFTKKNISIRIAVKNYTVPGLRVLTTLINNTKKLAVRSYSGNLIQNNITSTWSHIGDMKNLQEITLYFVGLNSDNVGALVEILIKMDSVKKLDVHHNQLKDEGAKILSTLLEKNNLTTLNLALNHIAASGTEAIIRKLENNTSLTTLILSNNDFGEIGATHIVTMIRQNKALQHLAISGNRIPIKNLQVIAKALNETITSRTMAVDLDVIAAYNDDAHLHKENNRWHVCQDIFNNN